MLLLALRNRRLGPVRYDVLSLEWEIEPSHSPWTPRLVALAADPELPNQSELARHLGVPLRALPAVRLGTSVGTTHRLDLSVDALKLLTPAERRIAVHLVLGSTAAEAAVAEGCSPRTVQAHARAIYRTFRVQTVEELVRTLAKPRAKILTFQEPRELLRA